MDREEIIQFLKSEPMKFTHAEIEQMMDEEIEKDPAEMDTDFIDLCADVLCKALDEYKEKELNKNTNSKRIKIKATKIAVIVAVIALILGMAVTASAKYVYNDTSDKIVQFYEDHFSINLRNGDTNADIHLDTGTELIAKLKDGGFDNIMLPSILLTDDYAYNVNITEDEEFLAVIVGFHNTSSGEIFNANITKYKNGINNILDNDMQITAEYDSAKQLSLSGIDILIFANKENSTIIYINGNTEYNLNLNNYDLDSAIDIAKSIK